jgi:hypothetical protein
MMGSVIRGEPAALQKYAMIRARETGMTYGSDFLKLNGVTEHQNWIWPAGAEGLYRP